MGKSYWMVEQNGNFTNDKNDIFDPKKRYIGVRLQQGVPLLDRDWNELEDIRRYEEMVTRREYIGNGSPDDGFNISACDPAANDFIIGIGHCMVDGFEVANENSLYYNKQNLKPLVPSTDKDRVDTVYLHVWINEVRSPATPEETDPEKFDSSLGNKDDVKVETSVRHKLVWRVGVDEGSGGNYKKNIVPLTPKVTNKFATLVLESKDIRNLKTGEILNLGEGYNLEAKQVDVDGEKVWLEFSKDEKFIADEIISVSTTSSSTNIWEVKLNDILDEDNVPVLRVNVKRVFQGAVDSIAEIDSIWLIDYEKAFTATNLEQAYEFHHYCDIARITRKKGINEIRDSDIEDLREGRGKDKLTIKSLTFKNDQLPSVNKWPKLTCEKESQVDVKGDIAVSGKIDVKGNLAVSGKIIQDEWVEDGFNTTDWEPSSRDYNTPGYFRDKNGIVHLRGAVKSKNLTKDSFIFKLAKGYIPEKKELHLVPSLLIGTTTTNGTWYCEISNEGVRFVNEVQKNFTYFLDGITFRAKQ